MGFQRVNLAGWPARRGRYTNLHCLMKMGISYVSRKRWPIILLRRRTGIDTGD